MLLETFPIEIRGYPEEYFTRVGKIKKVKGDKDKDK